MKEKNNESADNYLETILVLSKRLPVVRSVDIANELDFKKSSVSIAMKNLREKNHITVTDAGYIYLTESGKAIADMIYERHQILTSCLEKLGVSAEIAEKEGTISELNASVEKIKAALAKLEEDQKTWWNEKEVLVKELAKAKVAEKLGEVNEALEKYSDEEKEVAKDDIEKLTGDINACEKVEELNNVASEINSIINKINGASVDAQKKAEADAKIAEQNTQQKEEKIEVEDIFSEMCELEKDKENEDVNIF